MMLALALMSEIDREPIPKEERKEKKVLGNTENNYSLLNELFLNIFGIIYNKKGEDKNLFLSSFSSECS